MATLVKELKDLQNNFQTRVQLKVVPELFSLHSLMPWPSVVFAFVCSLSIIIISFITSEPFRKTDLIVGLLVLFFIILNMMLIVWMHIRKRKQIIHRISFLIDLVKDVQFEESTKEYVELLQNSNDPVLLNLPSHSFSIAYVTEKDAPVSFPTSLLQTGNTIQLCFGQASPCRAVCAHDGCVSLEKGEVMTKDKFSDEHLQSATKADDHHRFTVLRSPFCDELSNCLNDSRHASTYFNRPKSMLVRNREKAFLSLLYVALPLSCVITLVLITSWSMLKPCMVRDANSVVFSFFMEYDSDNFWFDLYVVSVVLITLPILPISAPLLWVILYLNGEAKTLVRCLTSPDKSNFKAKTGMLSPTTHSLDEILSSSGNMNDHTAWFKLLVKLLRGKKSVYILNAGVFDSLGSITALCCIDKEGILSWYHPMPEKISFLCGFQQDLIPDNDTIDEVEEQPNAEQSFTMHNLVESDQTNVKLEVMSLSRDKDTMKLQFDDHSWQHHIGSLKPIGLNILLTYLLHNENHIPAPSTDCEHMFVRELVEEIKKSSHNNLDKHGLFQKIVTRHRNQLNSISLELECSAPDIDRFAFGLQSICHVIGFADDVALLYSPKTVVTGYKKSVSYVGRKKPLSCLRPANLMASDKFCLEFVHSIVVSSWLDKGNCYLMSIGSGDLLINFCSHYWDGGDVKIFDEGQKKKTLDFAHRNSITGSCIGFAFRPVDTESVTTDDYMAKLDEENESRFSSDQIFLGLIALQYQPQVDVIRLIEVLDGASIRFVHFTPEDEFKARVFAEKMGLEVGWNCHISLARHSSTEQEATWQDASVNVTHSDSNSDEDDEATSALLSPQTPLSESSFSDSAFYQQNRAKLPRGIDNIIPHIEQVDNVPLLVPLFTDSDQKCMREMISIMQRYGEVVCCIGSSECIENIQVFAQADVSVAIRPMSSLLTGTASFNCFRESFAFPTPCNVDCQQTNRTKEGADFSSSSIMSLARSLNTFPCAVTLAGDNSISILYSMIKQARHTLFLSTICLMFLIKSYAMVSLIQVLIQLLSLPRIFTPLDVAWMTFVISPLLSFSLLASPLDPDLMTWASLKNMSKQGSKTGEVLTIIKRFTTKFLPSCVVVVFLYLFCLLSICGELRQNNLRLENITTFNSTNFRCYPCFDVSINSTVSNTVKALIQNYVFKQRLISQQLCLCALVFYLCLISSGYVHRWKSVRQKSPFSNKIWTAVVVIILSIQAVFSSIVITVYASTNDFLSTAFSHKIIVFIVFFVWPFPLLIINDVAKTREIKVWNRNQKRARLAFGTKLGMNSPF